MKNIQQMSYSTTQFQLLDPSLGQHHRVVSHLSPGEVAKPSASHLPDEETVLLVCEIVLGDVMMEGEEEALAPSTATVVFAHPFRVCQVESFVPVDLGVTGPRRIMMVLPSLYQIQSTPGLAQMSSQRTPMRQTRKVHKSLQ